MIHETRATVAAPQTPWSPAVSAAPRAATCRHISTGRASIPAARLGSIKGTKPRKILSQHHADAKPANFFLRNLRRLRHGHFGPCMCRVPIGMPESASKRQQISSVDIAAAFAVAANLCFSSCVRLAFTLGGSYLNTCFIMVAAIKIVTL